jgi:hypothetical protein
MAPFRLLLACIVSACVTSACGSVPRDPACEKAEVCDQALEDPFGNFGTDDHQFGDNGTCWLTETTATPCITACKQFLVDRRLEVDVDDDGRAEVLTQQTIVEACR